jgi:uncharacterized protein (DUF58 family)
MSNGITAEVSELIALQRFANAVRYRPEKRASLGGNHLSKRRGRGMDFAEVRNYQAGDEIRHMEWRITARTGKPHIKLYQEERERPVVLLADFSPTMYFGTRQEFKSVTAARLAAMLSWTALKQGDCVGGLFFSATKHNEYTPSKREEGVLTLLAALSDYTRKNPSADPQALKSRPLAHALLRLNRVARPGSILVLISDFYQFNEECFQLLTRLRGHNDILAYHVCDPLELAPPKPNYYAISNGDESMALDTSHPSVIKAYQHYCSDRIEKLEKQFARLQIQLIQVAPTDDIPRLVYDTFPRRKNA